MSNDDMPPDSHHKKLVELTRVQPFEAEVIAARFARLGHRRGRSVWIRCTSP